MKPLEATSSMPSTRRLLLVEDDQAVANLYLRIFQKEYALEWARNGDEAVGFLENLPFDAVVSDLSMPGLSGVALLKAMRERNRDVPIVIVTGHPAMESAITAVECRAIRYLVKPVELGELKISVASAIASSSSHPRETAWSEGELDTALATLYMAYQPILKPLERSVFGYEALVRSEHKGLSQPRDLLAAAEGLGAVKDLGRAIRRSVASGMGEIPEEARVFVNLHAWELLDDDLYSSGNPLSPHAPRIVFELTEQVQFAGAEERVRKLRSMGFGIAVDDLGAGYASLSHLVRFEPDYAKIDMNLVRDIDTHPSKRTLLTSLNAACCELGFELICEGVETRSEARCLLSLGVRLLQGYYFARPARSFGSEERQLLSRTCEGVDADMGDGSGPRSFPGRK